MRAWREALGLKQKQVASRLGRPQAWISNRETGKVDLTVDDAIEILRAMGYAADLVVVDGARPQLLRLVASVEPSEAAVALLLLDTLPRMRSEQRDMLIQMIEAAARTVPRMEQPEGTGS